MKYACIVLLLTLQTLSSGCGGGDENVSPDVIEDIDVTGQWSGSLGNNELITRGCGVSEVFYVLTLTQSGSAITGESRYDCASFSIYEVAGTILERQVSLTQTFDGVEILLTLSSAWNMSGVMSNPDGVVIADVDLSR